MWTGRLALARDVFEELDNMMLKIVTIDGGSKTTKVRFRQRISILSSVKELETLCGQLRMYQADLFDIYEAIKMYAKPSPSLIDVAVDHKQRAYWSRCV